jgi:hypothetical protein
MKTTIKTAKARPNKPGSLKKKISRGITRKSAPNIAKTMVKKPFQREGFTVNAPFLYKIPFTVE